jgi:CheY-like chemotaxis protein
MAVESTDASRQPRILFVDDDATILRTMQRVLRGDHERWHMIFVLGGADALVELRSGAFDLVVTDLDMPGIDGRAVMHAARQSQPPVRCILHTGSGPGAVALDDTCLLLAKPATAHELRDAIEQQLALT